LNDELNFVSKHRNIFANISFPFDDVKIWLRADINTTLYEFGVSKELIEDFMLFLDDKILANLRKEDGSFDFYKLIFGDNPKEKDFTIWANNILTWYRAIPLKWLKRNWFKDELFWQEDPNCSGFKVDDNPKCNLRAKEI